MEFQISHFDPIKQYKEDLLGYKKINTSTKKTESDYYKVNKRFFEEPNKLFLKSFSCVETGESKVHDGGKQIIHVKFSDNVSIPSVDGEHVYLPIDKEGEYKKYKLISPGFKATQQILEKIWVPLSNPYDNKYISNYASIKNIKFENSTSKYTLVFEEECNFSNSSFIELVWNYFPPLKYDADYRNIKVYDNKGAYNADTEKTKENEKLREMLTPYWKEIVSNTKNYKNSELINKFWDIREFIKQIADAELRLKKAEEEVVSIKEYKLKLQGGLETLDLLESPEPPEVDKPAKSK